MKCCNDCGPLKAGPIGPSCPEPLMPTCPPGYALECVPQDPFLPCPENYERVNGVCTYIYPWQDPAENPNIGIIEVNNPIAPLPYKYTVDVDARLVEINGGSCKDGGYMTPDRNLLYNRQFTILSFGAITIQTDSGLYKRFCRDSEQTLYPGDTWIKGDSIAPRKPLLKIYSQNNDESWYESFDSSTIFENTKDPWNPSYGNFTWGGYGCGSANQIDCVEGTCWLCSSYPYTISCYVERLETTVEDPNNGGRITRRSHFVHR